MSSLDPGAALVTRPVRVLAAGGTIAMRGERAVPALDASELVEQLPQVAGFHLEAETVLSLPSTHVSLADALDLARRAGQAASAGEGVVLTTGTDTMEEVAMLCALTYGGEAPIVITGANRPGSAPGADGPANLLDAIILARAPAALDLGVVVAFGGEVHAAATVRKIDSTGPVAFGSPTAGPLGRIVEGRVWLHATPRRPAPIAVERLEHRVATVTTGLGDDGAMLHHAGEVCDGVVLVALGAGHLSPAVLRELRRATERVPVLITCRPDRSSMLFSTYGFEGAERDLRASGAICVPFLSPAAARVALLCALGADLDRAAMAEALAPFDARQLGVYVDHAFAAGDWGRWTGGGHLQADTPEELHAFAERLGLKRAWFQSTPGRPENDHYDLGRRGRERALELGAIAEDRAAGARRRRAIRQARQVTD